MDLGRCPARGRTAKEVRKSGAVEDFIQRLGPSRGDVAARAPQNGIQPAPRLRVALELFVPLVGVLEFLVGEPRQELVELPLGEGP